MQTRQREVKGLVEALQVTPPRPCSADYLGVYSTTAQYPSLAALECLSAGTSSDCIWALAVLGGGAVYESETDALIQVNTPGRSCTQLATFHLLLVVHRRITCRTAAVVLAQHMCQQSIALTTAWSCCLVCVRACFNAQKLQLKFGLHPCSRSPDAACLHLYNACSDGSTSADSLRSAGRSKARLAKPDAYASCACLLGLGHSTPLQSCTGTHSGWQDG